MAQQFTTLSDFSGHGFDTTIDVRSPSEFAEDHIPGAINLPVLDDAERARVGKIYVQENPFDARKIGAALVAKNAARHLQGALADKDGSWQPLVYCWRGGQRSGSFATILSQVGWRSDTIDGGYRTYRRIVAAAMHDTTLPHRLILIDGYTGTAKTDILALLEKRGLQVVDLEGLAAHRGSVFGALERPQPAQKSFEGALAMAFDQFDPTRPVVVEAESSKIGQLQIPPSVWAAMRAAPRIRVSASLTARSQYLVQAYADVIRDSAQLKNRIEKLRPLQGAEVMERWHGYVDSGDMGGLAAELMAQHYDPRYAKSRAGMNVTLLGEINAPDLTPKSLNQVADRMARLIATA